MSSHHLHALCALIVMTAACRPDPTQDEPALIIERDMASDMTGDVGSARDMMTTLDLHTVPTDLGEKGDATMSADAEMAPDLQEEALPSTCEGACAAQELTITFGAETRSLSRAVYGLTAPEQPGGAWTIHIEAFEGELETCPEGPSTPAYTMTLSGVPLFEDDVPVDKTNLPDLNGVLFDYEGALVPEAPFYTRAQSLNVTARAISVCEACVGMPAPSDEDGFVALTIEATFQEGTIQGTLYARHCDNVDWAPEEE